MRVTNSLKLKLTRDGNLYWLSDGDGNVSARLEDPVDGEHVREWLSDALNDYVDDLLDGMDEKAGEGS